MLRRARLIVFASVALVLVIAFQNCGRSSHALRFSDESSKQSPDTDSGVGYDGKLFVVIGEACGDGTHVRSRIVVRSAEEANLVRRECADIEPVTLARSEWQIDPAKPNQLIFQKQAFTEWIPKNVGAGLAAMPKLTSPVDPTAYGANGNGTFDNTTAFQNAVNAGDMLIPAGTYVVNGTVRVPAGRNIQCADPNTVKIINPTRSAGGNQTFQFWTAGGSLSNCHLMGSNQLNANGSSAFDQAMQQNLLVGIVDYWGVQVSNIRVVNNIFENCHGNSCVTVYGGSGSGAANNGILYNTFRNCGYYGVVVDAGVDNLVAYNDVRDCSMGVQNDNTTQPNRSNIFEGNYLSVLNGNGQMFNKGGVAAWNLFLTGGISTGSDYSTNVIRYNALSGNGLAGSIEILKSAAKPAQYIDNICINGCSER